MTPKEKQKLLTILNTTYPNPKSELNFKNNYQLIVSVILSAQCTDKKVNEVTPILFKTYKHFAELAKADLKELETILRPINYYKTKAKNLIKMALLSWREHGGYLCIRRSPTPTS